MSALRVVMFGTGDFAAPTLSAILASTHMVQAVVTQPDRSGSSSRRASVNATRQRAVDAGLTVLQPENVNAAESLAALRELAADVFVVASYGQILSREFLAIPRLGSINVHASLLPKYRGASPVEAAILNGDRDAGVCIIGVVPKLDAGPVYAVASTPIDRQETAGELEDRLAALGGPLCVQVLDQLALGTANPQPQDESRVTKAAKLTKAQGEIDWSRSAEQLGWHVRGMQPWPGAWTHLHVSGKPALRVVVLQTAGASRAAAATPDASALSAASATPVATAPGRVLAAAAGVLTVQTGNGSLSILRLQPEGKRAMPVADFLNGYPVKPGDRLGSVQQPPQ